MSQATRASRRVQILTKQEPAIDSGLQWLWYNLSTDAVRYRRRGIQIDGPIIDPSSHFLYVVQRDSKAIRYGVGVGAEGFLWSGHATIDHKQEWPDWYPPAEMMARKPELRQHMVEMRGGGLGMNGGPENPLGARAMYLYFGGKDTLYRIHGTNEPWTIGTNISSGCIRLTNDDVVDLYKRTPVGTKVVVLPTTASVAIR